MHGRRYDRILTGTAVALVLALAATPVSAQNDQLTDDQAAIEARVPLPEPANMPPPTIADIADPAPETTGAINLPDPPDLPPPTYKDIAAPIQPAAPTA